MHYVRENHSMKRKEAIEMSEPTLMHKNENLEEIIETRELIMTTYHIERLS